MPKSAPPDASEERLLALAAGGERTIARIRLGIVVCIFAIPVFQALRALALDPETFVGLVGSASALGLSVVLLVLAERDEPPSWLPYVTAAADVTMVSGVLAIFLVLAHPHTAVNSKVVWEIYLFAIMGTALRPHRRVVILATMLAMAQYLAIVLYASLHWALNAASFAPFPYGMFSWEAQISRLLLIAAAGGLTYAFVKRTGRLTQLAGSDMLTGAYNRTLFEIRLREEVQRARRHRRTLSLAMVDLDRLKSLNDALGHDRGDEALVRAATVLRRGLRSSDNVFRYGGDEFAVLMPEAHAEEARARLARIATQLRSQRIAGRMLTLSIGIASVPRDATSAAALLQAADRNLYEAKRGGRNCIRDASA